MTCIKMMSSMYQDGEVGSPSNPEKYEDQDYQELHDSYFYDEKLFEDETFPANLESLGNVEGLTTEVKWLRPKDISDNPAFIVGGTSRFDFKQGQIGNCWFLASIGALTFRKPLMEEVVPLDQNLKDDYAGIFHFRFWRFGKWVDVVIDDLLPTVEEELLSVSSGSGNEFWAPLLEKAYAKVCGSYADMIAGNPAEALKDFSGGVHMNYNLAKPLTSGLWDTINRAAKCKTMMGCGTYGGEKGKQADGVGLVDAHAYAVTGVKEVDSDGTKVNLIRIWNPWGEKEWNGDWSDKSPLWDTVSPDERDHCLKVRNDGEFWMKMEDFCVYYENMDICCENPNFLDDDAACQWSCSLKEGRWEAGISDGGCDNTTDGFWTNPQFRMTLKAVEGDQGEDNNVLLSLMQKPDEPHRSKAEYHYIGITIYEVPPEAPKGRLSSSVFGPIPPLKFTDFSNTRELIEFVGLEPGEYLLVPSTHDSNKTSDFILTIYTKAESQMD